MIILEGIKAHVIEGLKRNLGIGQVKPKCYIAPWVNYLITRCSEQKYRKVSIWKEKAFQAKMN